MTTRITSAGVVFNDSTQQTTQGVEFSSGTLMLFQQSSAPTGWTKQTTHNNKTLRVVSGTAGSGGSVEFTGVFSSGLSAGATTLSSGMIPSHNHSSGTYFIWDMASPAFGVLDAANRSNCAARYEGPNPYSYRHYTSSTGDNLSHNHSLPSFDIQYVDLIIASKN